MLTTDKHMVGYYAISPYFMLENFNTNTLKHNKIVNKEDNGLHNQKY